MLIKNTAIYGSTTAIKGIFSFLRIAVFTRLLSPDSYGDFAIVMALVSFTDAFAFQWIRQTIMRHVTHHPADTDKDYLSSSIFLYSLFGGICLLSTFVMIITGTDNHTLKMIFELTGILIAAESFSNLFILLARIRLNHKLFFILNTIKPIISLLVGSYLIMYGMGTSGALYGMGIALILNCAIGVIFSKDLRAVKFTHVKKEHLQAIARFGLPLIIVYSLQSAIKATDRLLLEALIGDGITGLYAASQDIPFRLLNLIALTVHLAAYPLAVQKLDHENQDSCIAQLKLNFILLFGILFPAALGMALLSGHMAYIFLGEAFRGFAVENLSYFILVSFINCLTQYYFILSFNLKKQTKKLVPAFAAGVLINLVIGIYAIPYWQEKGAILGSFLAYTAVLAFVLTRAKGLFKMPVPLKESLAIIGSGLFMALIVSIVSGNDQSLLNFLFCVLAGILSYSLLMLLLNPVNIRNHILAYLRKKTDQ
jgi:O-antigen/teichoic acid export membrane protein